MREGAHGVTDLMRGRKPRAGFQVVSSDYVISICLALAALTLNLTFFSSSLREKNENSYNSVVSFFRFVLFIYLFFGFF